MGFTLGSKNSKCGFPTTFGSKNLGMELDGVRKLNPRRAWVGGSAKTFFLNVLKGIRGLCSSANNF